MYIYSILVSSASTTWTRCTCVKEKCNGSILTGINQTNMWVGTLPFITYYCSYVYTFRSPPLALKSFSLKAQTHSIAQHRTASHSIAQCKMSQWAFCVCLENPRWRSSEYKLILSARLIHDWVAWQRCIPIPSNMIWHDAECVEERGLTHCLSRNSMARSVSSRRCRSSMWDMVLCCKKNWTLTGEVEALRTS